MPVYYDSKNEKYYVMFYAKDIRGINRKYKKTGFKRKKDAQNYEIDFKKKISYSYDITFKELSELFLQDYKKKVKMTSYYHRKLLLDKYTDYLSSLNISKITPVVIDEYTEHLKKIVSEHTKKTLSDRYIVDIIKSVKMNFKYAERKLGFKEKNPCDAITFRINPSTIEEKSIWTLEEFNKFINEYIKKENNLPLELGFKILFWSGIRISELLALEIKDINFKSSTIKINKNRSVVNGTVYIRTPKTASSNRTITIPEQLTDEIKIYIDKLYKPKPDDRIIPFSKNIFNNKLKTKKFIDLGIPLITIHGLRHSHASYLIKEGINIVLISRRLGHSNVQITLSTYAHVYSEVAKELSKELNKLYKK